MNLLAIAAAALPGVPLTGDDTPLQTLAMLAALALCVLTGITCWRVFFASRKKAEKEQLHDENQTPPQEPQ